MLRILLSVGNIVFSLILGALLMALVAIYSPGTLSHDLGWARSFKASSPPPGSTRSTTYGRSCCSKTPAPLMFFTVIARIYPGIARLSDRARCASGFRRPITANRETTCRLRQCSRFRRQLTSLEVPFSSSVRTARTGAGRGRRAVASAWLLSSSARCARRAPRSAGRGSSRRDARPRARRRSRGCARAPG